MLVRVKEFTRSGDVTREFIVDPDVFTAEEQEDFRALFKSTVARSPFDALYCLDNAWKNDPISGEQFFEAIGFEKGKWKKRNRLN